MLRINIITFARITFLTMLYMSFLALLSQQTVSAQTGKALTNKESISSDEKFRRSINDNTITILGGSLTGTYLRLIDDISRSIGDGDKLRIIPVRGGVVTNVRDILYLRGIDMGIIRADVIETYKGKPHFSNIKNRLNYVSVLHPEEFHLMTSNPDIRSIRDLEGKTVAFHSETYLSGQIVLEKLGIRIAKSIRTNMFAAAEKTKTGEYDAIMRVTGKPFGGVKRLLKIDPKLRLIPIPFDNRLIHTTYLPARISPRDYPGLLPEGRSIQTIAVNAILGVYNWKKNTNRYRRLEKFTTALFSQHRKILKRKERHPKWNQINLAASLPGWNRFPPAAKWLQKARKEQFTKLKNKPVKKTNDQDLYDQFKKFIAQGGHASNELEEVRMRRMFENFKKWREQNQQGK